MWFFTEKLWPTEMTCWYFWVWNVQRRCRSRFKPDDFCSGGWDPPGLQRAGFCSGLDKWHGDGSSPMPAPCCWDSLLFSLPVLSTSSNVFLSSYSSPSSASGPVLLWHRILDHNHSGWHESEFDWISSGFLFYTFFIIISRVLYLIKH